MSHPFLSSKKGMEPGDFYVFFSPYDPILKLMLWRMGHEMSVALSMGKSHNISLAPSSPSPHTQYD